MSKFKYPRSIYVLYIGTLLTSFDFFGVYLIPFFTDWGGISVLQVTALQSIFQFSVIPLEIPTGVIGDKFGKKFSVIVGMVLLSISPIVYGVYPNFWIFVVAELMFAAAVAFFSGAEEALIKVILHRGGYAGDALDTALSDVKLTNSNVKSITMVIGAFCAPLMLKLFGDYNFLMLSSVPFFLSATLILAYGVENDRSGNSSLVPDYKKIISDSISQIRSNQQLGRIVLFLTIIGVPGYFVVWYNQLYMIEIGLAEQYWGVARISFLGGQFLLGILLVVVVNRVRFSGVLDFIVILLIMIPLVVSIFRSDLIGLGALFIGGSISILTRDLYSGQLNRSIPEEIQTTVLSFVGVVRRLTLGILNPFVGFLGQANLTYALSFLCICCLGAFALLAIYMIFPLNKD